MVEKRLTRRDLAGLPQPNRAGLLASAGGARETHAARETTAAGASFFAFLSHIARSQHKQRISHQTSDRSRGTLAGDWRWRVYTNNVAATTTNGADPSDTRPWGHFLTWTPCSEPQHTRWPITLPQIGGHDEERTHNDRCTHEHRCKLGRTHTQRAACPATQMCANFSFAGLSTLQSGASYPSPLCPHASSLAHACANVLFAHVCHACCVCIHLSSRIFAYGPLGGRAHAPLSLCVHAHCYCATVRYTARVYTRASQHVGACIFLFCVMQRTLGAD